MGTVPMSVPESPKRTAARQLITEGKLTDALTLLGALAEEQPDAEVHALMGLAYYRTEQYTLAADQYDIALQLAPGVPEWAEMLAQAKGNAIAEIHVPVPDLYYFDREKLLAKPEIPAGTLPPPPATHPRRGAASRILTVFGNLFGACVSFLMHSLAQVWGTMVGYRDRIWTNWYRRPMTLGILTLAYMRNKLNKHNLRNTYPGGRLTAFQPEGQAPPEGVTHFRTPDGSWNNLANPKEGAAGTRFLRKWETRRSGPRPVRSC